MQNRGEAEVKVKLDLTRSRGIATNQSGNSHLTLDSSNSNVINSYYQLFQGLAFTLSVPKKSSLVAAHVLAADEGSPWQLEAEARLVN